MAARRSTIDKENRVGGTSAYSPSAYLKHVDADSYRSQVGSLTQCLCVCGGGLDGTLDGLLVRLCSTTAVRVAGRPLFPRMHPHIPSPSVLPAALSRARFLTPPHSRGDALCCGHPARSHSLRPYVRRPFTHPARAPCFIHCALIVCSFFPPKGRSPLGLMSMMSEASTNAKLHQDKDIAGALQRE